jgi:hypothetical protein
MLNIKSVTIFKKTFMKNNYISQKFNPDEVLNIIIEKYRLTCPFDPGADPYIKLNFSTTIKSWIFRCNLLPWDELYLFYKNLFDLKITHSEWNEFWNLTKSEKTLYDFCEFISINSKLEDIKPIKILGTECLSASVYYEFLKRLKNKNTLVSKISPNSELKNFLIDDNDFSNIISEMIVLSKGRRVISKIIVSKKKNNFWNIKSIFNKNYYYYFGDEIITFRDLIEKIIELQRN